MRPSGRLVALIGTIVTAVALVFVVILILVTVLTPAPMAPITSIEFSQSKPVPNFSDSTHTTTEPARIAAFTALVKKYSIDPSNFDSALNDECTGGLTTDITLAFGGSKTAKLRLYDCGRTVPRGTFVSDATALFTGWRTADGA